MSRRVSRTMSTLVVAEHTAGHLSPGTLATLSAASLLQRPISLLLAGSEDMKDLVSEASCFPIEKVFVAQNEALSHSLAEPLSDLLFQMQNLHSFHYIVSPSSNNTKNFLPRLAALLDAAPITDVIEIVNDSTFLRPTYAGNALSTTSTSEKVVLLSIRSTAFSAMEKSNATAVVEEVTIKEPLFTPTTVLSSNTTQSDRPELTAARVVIAGGRGMKNGENFKLLETLADSMQGAVGASRAAVDAGYVPNELQVGQTGKVVAPDLYIAVGISGAIQHLAGMKDSKTIVAINKDEDAPIFQVADYGLVADLFTVLPELTKKMV